MEELLIEKVRGHEVLYNHKLPDYRDQHIRQRAWDEIGNELNISEYLIIIYLIFPADAIQNQLAVQLMLFYLVEGNEAKERWEKVRRCFCNARNRRMTSKKKSFWKYEKLMAFLTPFQETRKTYGNLNKSRASVSFLTKSEHILSEGSDIEETAPIQEQEQRAENKQAVLSNQVAGEEETSNITRSYEKRYDNLKSVQNKKRQKNMNTPTYQMVQILKENSALRRRKYEDKSMGPKPFKTTRPLETLDDTDMFFLSMSRMTKQLPKIDQAQIKLALSNSVLSAEIRNQQRCSTPYTQHSFPSPSPSHIQLITSPSDDSN